MSEQKEPLTEAEGERFLADLDAERHTPGASKDYPSLARFGARLAQLQAGDASTFSAEANGAEPASPSNHAQHREGTSLGFNWGSAMTAAAAMAVLTAGLFFLYISQTRSPRAENRPPVKQNQVAGESDREPPTTPAVPEDADARKISTLIRRLSDDEFSIREAAFAELLQIGEPARKALEAALETDDLEMSSRTKTLLAAIRTKEVERAFIRERHLQEWMPALARGELSGPALGARDVGEPAESPPYRVPEPPSTDPVNSGLDWLSRAQEVDGQWNSLKWGAQEDADIEQTAFALLAFLGAGHTEKVGKYKDHVIRAVAWLRKNQRSDGSWTRKDSPRVDGLAQALAGCALAEAAGMGRKPDTIACAQKAADYSTATHQSMLGSLHSGFGRAARATTPDLFTSTLFLLQLKSAQVAGLKVPPESMEGLNRFLDSLQDAEAKSYRLVPHGKCTAQAVFLACLCRQFTGTLKADLQPYMEQASQEYGFASEGKNAQDLMINYFGTLAAFQQGGEIWEKWYKEMRRVLCASQRSAGSEAGSWDPFGPWSGGGRILFTALQALELEVYYRYLPLYKE